MHPKLTIQRDSVRNMKEMILSEILKTDEFKTTAVTSL